MIRNSFSTEVAVLRRILRISPLVLIGFLAACSAGDDLTGPGVDPRAALAGASSTPTPVLTQTQPPSSNNPLGKKEGRRRGVRYAMGAN
jgi:hypothetical protein